MGITHFLDLSLWQWVWITISAVLLGFSKTGLSGAIMLVIPIVAGAFGGKYSTGILLPMLIIGDIFAIIYYNRHAEWNNIRKVIPWTLFGLIAGTVVGNRINDAQFKALIAISVLICLVILIYSEIKGNNMKVSEKPWLYILLGILCGFTSMIGNAAGPIFSVYLLAKGFKKNDFMGTTAVFFFISNMTKLPLQFFLWHNISIKTLIMTMVMIPAIAVGALFGAVIMKKVNEKIFRYLIVIMTALASIKLFI